MFTIDGYDYEFRIKEMKALEMMAVKNRLARLDTIEETIEFFNNVLERIEVKAGNDWIACYSDGIYYPAGLDKDVTLNDAIIGYFMEEVIKPLFSKSSESKK